MDTRGISTTDVFSLTVQQADQLESLANSALSSGIDQYVNKNYERAVKEFKRAVALAPNASSAVEALNYMAQVYLNLNDAQGAIDCYKRAVALDPTREDTRTSLAKLYYFEKRYEEAQREYEQVVRLNPNAANRFSLGQAYMANGRYSDAEEQFKKVQALEPQKPGGYYGLGQSYARRGLFDEAVMAFKEAIGVQEDFYDAYAELGYAYADAGRIDEAEDVLEFLEDHDSDLAGTLSGYIYQVRAPRIFFADPVKSSFPYYRYSAGTRLSALDAYLANAGASKTYSMTFYFDKPMDRQSVQDPFNWRIGRSEETGAGRLYNFGLAIPSTEITLNPFPVSVQYDAENWSATVRFVLQQNTTGDGTIDPGHIQFAFCGKDAFGVTMDRKADQFMGFSGVI